MGLYGVLRNALGGIDATQAGLDVVSRNVANSGTAGYTKQSLTPRVEDYGGTSAGVKPGEVQRVMSQMLVKQLRGELSGAGYASTRQSFLERLEISFGAPGAANGIESLYSGFDASLKRLVASPENPSTRAELVQSANLLASGLNSLSHAVQTMRGEAEYAVGDAVTRVNQLLEGIAQANQKIAFAPKDDPIVLDQRDRMISELTGLMEVRALPPAADGTVSVLSRSGTLLVSDVPMKLTFEGQQSTVGAHSSLENGTLGTIVLTGPGRPPVDLVGEGAFRSGEIGALLELRDETLVDAQNSLDALADGMARALSTIDVASTAVTDGRRIDASGLSSGDRISFAYDDGGTAATVTFVATNGNAAGLDGAATARTDDTVVGIDFSQSDADVAQAMQDALTALGITTTTVTAAGGGSFDFVDTASAGGAIEELSAQATATSLTGQLAIPLFTDGTRPYTGSFDGGSQQLGFAGRIRVNQTLLSDTTALSVYKDEASTPLGDPARPNHMVERLQAVEIRLPNGAIAAGKPTTKGNLGNLVSRIISTQAMRANAANEARDAQTQVVAQLEERVALKSGVNIDEEMARLIELQTAYQANAQVVATYKDMISLLLEL